MRFEDLRENFYDKNGQPFLVRCPKCLLENWAPAVASGECAWCEYKEKKKIINTLEESEHTGDSK